MDIQTAMMQRDRQIPLIMLPDFLKHQLRLRPRVDEHDRHPRLRDPRQHRGCRRQPHMPRPRNPPLRQQQLHTGCGPRLALNQPRLSPHISQQRPRMRHGGRQPRHPRAGNRLQPGQT